MNKLDTFIIILTLTSAIIGLIRGLTKEILSLISWSGAAVCAYLGMSLAKHVARQYIANPMLADAATVFFIFLIFLIMFSLISHILSGMVRQSVLGGIDRSLGFGFGVVRAVTLMFFLEITLGFFILRPNHPDFIKESRFAEFIYKGSDTLFSILPLNVQGWIKMQQQRRLQESSHSPEMPKAMQDIVEDTLVKDLRKVEKSLQSVEELAKLKPKPSKANDNADETAKYSNKQNVDMERLLNQADGD